MATSATAATSKLTVVPKSETQDQKVGPKASGGHLPFAEKLPANPVSAKEMVTLDTNIRRIVMLKNVPIYKYDVKILLPVRNREIEVSRSMRKSPNHAKNLTICTLAYKGLIATVEPFVNERGSWFYDRQSCLYGLSDIKEIVRTIETQALRDVGVMTAVTIKITKVRASFQASSNDINRTVSSAPAEKDVTLHEALNTILSSAAYERSPEVVTIGACVHYLLNPGAHGIYDAQPPAADRGKTQNRWYGVGVKKAVKTLEGQGKDYVLAAPTEMVRSMFQKDHWTLIEYFKTISGFHDNLTRETPAAVEMIKAVKGIRVYINYGPTRNLLENGVNHIVRGAGRAANREEFTKDGEDTNVFRYFQDEHEITLRYPNFFTIAVRGMGGRDIFIPAECLVIAPNQIVRTEQMIADEQANLIRAAACPPDDRYKISRQVADAVGIGQNNGDMLELAQNTIRIPGFVLQKPKHHFGAVLPDLPKKFFKPATLTNWLVVFQKGHEAYDAGKELVKQMRLSGMQVASPDLQSLYGDPDVQRNSGNPELRSLFERAKKTGCNLMMFITPTKCHYHQAIKALEQEFDVLTQDIKLNIALDAVRMKQTRENIVAKTNIKLGGLNYTAYGDGLNADQGALFIGLETSTQAGEALTVGYAANTMALPTEFRGAYKYVKRDPDVYGSVIYDIVKESITAYERSRKTQPKQIYIYINGLSEGSYWLIRENYVRLAQEAFEACTRPNAPRYNPDLTVIAATKRHIERLFLKPETGTKLQNVDPGTVVDRGIVNPVVNEWYHAGAKAIKGTAKPVKYTLIYKTNKSIVMKNLEEMTNNLCNIHQICETPVSLPAPLFIAGRCAQRGAAVLAKAGGPRTRRIGEETEVDYEATNAMFTYSGKNIRATRFNA